MSMRAAIATVRAKLEDPATGLKAKAEALVIAEGLAAAGIRTDFQFVAWVVPGRMLKASAPNIMVRPRRWVADQKLAGQTWRNGQLPIDVAYELFGGDADLKQNSVMIVGTALAQCMDELRDFNDAQVPTGPILDLMGSLDFQIGDFGSRATSSGFIATVTLLERGAQ